MQKNGAFALALQVFAEMLLLLISILFTVLVAAPVLNNMAMVPLLVAKEFEAITFELMRWALLVRAVLLIPKKDALLFDRYALFVSELEEMETELLKLPV